MIEKLRPFQLRFLRNALAPGIETAAVSIPMSMAPRSWATGAVYRDRGLDRSNFFRPMPGSRALDITELAHLVQ